MRTCRCLLCLVMFLVLVAAACAQELETSRDTSTVYEMGEIVILHDTASTDAVTAYYKANESSTTEDILARSQSIQLIRRGSFGMEPTIRGCSAGQIAVTIEGMHITGACTDKMDPVTIYVEPQNLRSIEVLTGTNGLMFGSAIGGSLNMKLAEPELNAARVTLGSGFQSAASALHETMSLNAGSDRYALLINGAYRHSGNYRKGGGGQIPFSQSEKMNWSLATMFRLSEAEVVKADVLFDDGWNIGFPALTMDVGLARARIYSISYQRRNLPSSIKSIEAKLYGNSIVHAMDDTRRPSVAMHMDMPGWSATYGGYAEVHAEVLDAHATFLRAEVTRTNVRAEMTMYPPNDAAMFMLTLPDARRWSLGLFVNDKWLISDRYSLSTNLRAEYLMVQVTSLFGTQQLSVFGYDVSEGMNDVLIGGTLNLTRLLSENSEATVTLGYGKRASTMNELFGFYLYNRYDGFDYIGNPRLGNEGSLQMELAFLHHTDALQFKASAFYNRMNNYVLGKSDTSLSVMTIGARGVKVFHNTPSATIVGAEISVVLHASENLDFVSTAKYLRGEDDRSIPLPLIAPLKFVASARYRFYEFVLQCEAEYASAQHRVRVEDGEQPTPSYLLGNLRISHVVPLGPASMMISCGVENIGDLLYRDHLDWGGIPRSGRNFYITTTYSQAFRGE